MSAVITSDYHGLSPGMIVRLSNGKTYIVTKTTGSTMLLGPLPWWRRVWMWLVRDWERTVEDYYNVRFWWINRRRATWL